MLVLSRKIDESVWIDGMIKVKILEINGGHVKLGFSAPSDVAIQREEIRDAYPVPSESWQRCSALAGICT
jgi:carbon storage regulator CsrA